MKNDDVAYVDNSITPIVVKPMNRSSGNSNSVLDHTHPNLQYINSLTETTLDAEISSEVFNTVGDTW